VLIAGVRPDPLVLSLAHMLRRAVLCGLAALAGAEPRPGGPPTAFALRQQRLAHGMRLRGGAGPAEGDAIRGGKAAEFMRKGEGRGRGRGVTDTCMPESWVC